MIPLYSVWLREVSVRGGAIADRNKRRLVCSLLPPEDIAGKMKAEDGTRAVVDLVHRCGELAAVALVKLWYRIHKEDLPEDVDETRAYVLTDVSLTHVEYSTQVKDNSPAPAKPARVLGID